MMTPEQRANHPLNPDNRNGNGKAVATAENSLTIAMAERYGMDTRAFELTVRATCGLEKASREEWAAFLLVAKEYSLNPVTRQIYAFPKRGGGIVPIVSIDGWIDLVNRHPAFDGMEFVAKDKKGELVSMVCRLYRKDRSRPVEVEELLAECKRNTDPWNTMPHRMLRHKAMIQCARYAFGFSGIYDEEEGAVIAEARDITPPPAPPAPPPKPEEYHASGYVEVAERLAKKEPYPELPPELDRRKGAVEAEVIEEPAGMTPAELEAYLDAQGIKAPSEVNL